MADQKCDVKGCTRDARKGTRLCPHCQILKQNGKIKMPKIPPTK